MIRNTIITNCRQTHRTCIILIRKSVKTRGSKMQLKYSNVESFIQHLPALFFLCKAVACLLFPCLVVALTEEGLLNIMSILALIYIFVTKVKPVNSVSLDQTAQICIWLIYICIICLHSLVLICVYNKRKGFFILFLFSSLYTRKFRHRQILAIQPIDLHLH